MTGPDLVVRIGGPADRHLAGAAAALIDSAARSADVARRAPDLLAAKIESGRAVVALAGDELVGFGYFSEWQGGRFVSHSGLVVRDDHRQHGVGRRVKEMLVQASRRMFPQATLMSLTTSPAVEKLNLALGYQHVPLDELTDDPEFWKGCLTCRNYEEVQRQGRKCCCFGMVLRPGQGPS